MPAEPEIGITNLIDRLKSHVAGLGHYTAVLGHEPKNAPADMTAAIWVVRVRPSILSNLSNAAALVVCTVRTYLAAFSEPLDDIEVRLNNAVDALVTSFSAGFTLGGAVVGIDALGSNGDPLGWITGYVTIDKSLYRIADLTVPIVCHDTWAHTA